MLFRIPKRPVNIAHTRGFTPAVIGLAKGDQMPFTINAINSAGPTTSSCVTAGDAVDKVLQLEQQGYESIVVKDAAGLTISLDELSALCVAGED